MPTTLPVFDRTPRYDYTSKEDMLALATVVRNVPNNKLSSFIANVLDLDLMRVPWWLDKLVRLQCWLRGRSLVDAWFLVLERTPSVAEDIRQGTIRHILEGKDLDDPRSAGGLNASEVDTLVAILILHGLLPPLTEAEHELLEAAE